MPFSIQKIKIKFNYDRANIIVKLYEAILRMETINPNNTREYKAIKCVLSKITLRIKKKLLEKNKQSKEFTMSFEYNEVLVLYQFIKGAGHYYSGIYESNLIRLLLIQIDQKL